MEASRNNRFFVALLVGVFAVTAVACGGDDDETPTPTPTAQAEAVIPPRLTVLEAPVQYRPTESDELEELEADTEMELQPAANVVVGSGGRAEIAWEGFLSNELLAGTDSLLSLSLPSERRAIVDQASGTARYVISEPQGDASSDLQVIAGWITVAVTEAPADFIVTFVPGEDPTAWVAMLDGDASVVGQESVELTTIGAGEAAAFPQSIQDRDPSEPAVAGEAGIPVVLAVDPARVNGWYEDHAQGEADGPISTVAMRCEIVADGTVLLAAADDDADETGDALAAGDLVDVMERDDTGQWLRVEPIVGGDAGWLGVDAVACNAPPSDAVLPVAPDQPTPTQRPLPTRAPVRPTFTPGPSPTPVPSVTPAVEAIISFSADETEIRRGECATLSWSVENIQRVFLNGQGVTGSGSREVCPDTDTTYTLTVQLIGGGEESRSIEIEVGAPDATDTPQPTNTRRPQATETPRPTARPTNTQAPPTLTSVPTAPPPTNTSPPPTDTQPPPPTDTQPPPPTDEPQPTPTQEP